jgi:hypothetical protein
MGVSIAFDAGFMFNLPGPNIDTYDAYYSNLRLTQKRFSFSAGVLFCRSEPGHKFEPSLGYLLRAQYRIMDTKRVNLFCNYSFLKFTQKSGSRDYVRVHILHHMLGIGTESALIRNKLFLFSNTEFGWARYYFDDPYPGWGRYRVLMIDLGLRYKF